MQDVRLPEERLEKRPGLTDISHGLVRRQAGG